MDKKKRKFSYDQYKEKRGKYTRLLRIVCEKCHSEVSHYQKDGPGTLRRMYLDRITEPKVSLNKKELYCPNNHQLGIKINWQKENRPAFRLFVEAVEKKIVKL